MPFPTCIVCPTCHAAFGPTPAADAIVCPGGHRFATSAGIVDLLGTPTPTTPAAIVNEWAITAWAYERLWRPIALTLLSGTRFPLSREAAILRAALPADPRTILDLGCANGFYARTIAQAVIPAAVQHGCPTPQIIAVDRAAPMLRVAARHPRADHQHITWLRADAADLPIADHTVDTIVSGGTFNECEALDAVLTDTTRVATPAARLFSMHLVDPTAQTPPPAAPSGVRLFAPTEIPTRLAALGWTILSTTTIGRVQFCTATRNN